MRCLICHNLSLSTFCKDCKKSILKPDMTKRQIGMLDVYSFYKYTHIQELIHTKHTPLGYKVFNALAKLSFTPFIDSFLSVDNREIYIIGIDENPKNSFSHVAVLTHAMKRRNAKVQHTSLLASSNMSYSGQSLEFRLSNPRKFTYTGKKNIDAILVDDIITTGTTLQEAMIVLKKNGVRVQFALTLADARE
ncbi:MAG: phosphoribosyltransferase [Sulfurovum sp. AS07-7]|nr:MAG: phosphoribosyltransferase [Sulfurovum sp. AS07-7]